MSLTGRKTTGALLRQAFVTWIRSRDDVPEAVLESTAHAMKHALETGASSTYDRGFHEKVQRGAFDFCTKFATEFEESHAKDPLVTAVAAPPMDVAEYTGKHTYG